MSLKISLRPFRLQDLDDDYCRWYENTDGHLDFFSGSGRTFSKEVLARDYEVGKKDKTVFYYIIESAGGERIGNVKIGPIDKKNKTSDLVCLIGNRDFLGKGIATQAVALATDIAFEKHDIRRLHSGMHAQNIASIKAYTKAGWSIESVFKGYYLVDEKPEDRVCVVCFNPAYFEL